MTINLLIIEDNPADFLLLKRYLKQVELAADCVCVDSNDALEQALKNRHWDVVLADYRVPGMDMISSLQLIQRYAEDVSVILISGELRTEEAVRLLRQGLSDFIPKNDVSRLEHVILRSVGEMHAKRAKREAERALRRAASVFEYTHEGIVICDVQGLIVDVNQAFVNLSGYSKAELLGQSPKLFASGRHDQFFRASIWKALFENGVWRGEIWDRHKQGELFVRLVTINAVLDQQGHIQNYVAMYADISALKNYQQQLENIAHYDALTGLPNRLLLDDRLQQAILNVQRNASRIAVVYLDLDGFKQVNDVYGHQAGDQLLIDAAKRMRQTVREGDTVARLGGDEFVLILQNFGEDEEHLTILQRLLSCLSAPFDWQDHQLHISASIGITFLTKNTHADPNRLLNEADQAMYQAKQAGKNRYCIFQPESI